MTPLHGNKALCRLDSDKSLLTEKVSHICTNALFREAIVQFAQAIKDCAVWDVSG